MVILLFTRSMYSFWGLILGISMFGTLLPKNDVKIADPSSPRDGLQPLKIPRRYADINYQLRRPDVLANKACYNRATALCDLLGGKEGRFQMRCIRKCMLVSVYTQTLESYISFRFRSFKTFKSLIHMKCRPCMTRMTMYGACWMNGTVEVVALKYLALPLTVVPLLMLGGVAFLGFLGMDNSRFRSMIFSLKNLPLIPHWYPIDTPLILHWYPIDRGYF